MLKTFLLLLSILLALPPLASAERPNLTLAEVNGHKISSQDVDEIIAKEFSVQESLLKEESKHFLKLKIVNQLIDKYLIESQAAQALKLEQSELKELTKDQIIDKYLSDFVLSEPIDSQSPKIKKPVIPEERRIRIIHLKKGEEERAIKLQRQLVSNPDLFESLAKEHSIAPSRLRGGDMGYLTENQLPKELSQIVFSLSEKDISEVILFDEGLAIAMIDEIKTNSNSETDAEFAIQNLRKIGNEQLINQHLKSLRSKAKIIVYID